MFLFRIECVPLAMDFVRFPSPLAGYVELFSFFINFRPTQKEKQGNSICFTRAIVIVVAAVVVVVAECQ